MSRSLAATCPLRELQIGNLTQEHETLPRDATPREHVCAMADIEPVGCARFLISYGLTYRQVDCPIEEVRSWGPRVRRLGCRGWVIEEPDECAGCGFVLRVGVLDTPRSGLTTLSQTLGALRRALSSTPGLGRECCSPSLRCGASTC